MASRKPGNERQYNSENDKHENSTSGLETFIAQKYGEGAAIKQQARYQNEIPRESLGADCNILHLCLLDATKAGRGFS